MNDNDSILALEVNSSTSQLRARILRYDIAIQIIRIKNE